MGVYEDCEALAGRPCRSPSIENVLNPYEYWTGPLLLQSTLECTYASEHTTYYNKAEVAPTFTYLRDFHPTAFYTATNQRPVHRNIEHLAHASSYLVFTPNRIPSSIDHTLHAVRQMVPPCAGCHKNLEKVVARRPRRRDAIPLHVSGAFLLGQVHDASR